MNTGELYGLHFEATLNKIKHTNAEKLNLGGGRLLWRGILAKKREIYLKKPKPKQQQKDKYNFYIKGPTKATGSVH